MKKKNVRKLSKKGVALLAAAAMSVMVLCQTGYSVLAEATELSIEISNLLPDNITIEEPTALSNVELPSSEYGTLSWADGSFIPEERVQSCKVIFKSSGKIDLSHITGWDSESQSFIGKITVVVNSIAAEPTETPDVPEEPQILPTETPEEMPGVSEIPESLPVDTPEPLPTDIPEVFPTEIPEQQPMETPDMQETPQALPTEPPEIPPTEAPGVTETPEIPPTETPDVTETPEILPTDTPEVLPEDVPEICPTQVPEEPTPTEAPDIFDTPAQPEQEERPDSAADNLTSEEQAARAAENHTSNGITVHGDIPWYVQFRVSGGEEYSFRNAEGADIFKSYEFQLWDLKNDMEYQIPDGQYVSVTVPVKAGYDYSVEHILANGATETIIPSVEGTIMVFSTHSFSPFGIAGSKPIVGGEIGDKGYENVEPSSPDVTATPTPGAVLTATPIPTAVPESPQPPVSGSQETGPVVPGGNTVTGESSPTGGQNNNTSSPDSQISMNNQTSDDSDNADNKVSSSDSNAGSSIPNNTGSKTQNPRAVKTGDNTMIYPFVILLAVAVIAVIVVVVVKKKK